MGNKLDSILVKSCNPQQQKRQQLATTTTFRDSRNPQQQQWQHQQFNQSYNQQNPPQHFQQQLNQQNLQQEQNQQQPSNQQHRQQRKKQQKPRKQHKGFFKRSRLSSCPDLLKDNSVDFKLLHFPDNNFREQQREEKEVNIKVYRSYTDIRTAKEDPVKVTLYRRSRESLAEQHKAHSYCTGVNKFDRLSVDVGGFYGNNLSLSNKSIISIATTPAYYEPNRPPSRRSLSRCSYNSNNALAPQKPPLNLDDFPSDEVVRRKTQTFEHFFCNFTVKHFKQLTLLDQLSCLCVAIMPDRANQSLSLLQYLRSNELLLLSTAALPATDSCSAAEDYTAKEVQSRLEVDGLKERSRNKGSHGACYDDNNSIFDRNEVTDGRYGRNNCFNNDLNIKYDKIKQGIYDNAIYPTLPGYMCHEIDQLKSNLSSEHHVIMCQDLTERIITYLSKTVASELSRIFEYQLSLTQENIALRLLAKFACNNIFEAVRSKGRLLHRNTMLTIAMATNSQSKSYSDGPAAKWISVMSFGKELKWNIYDVLRRPALRKDNHNGPSNSLMSASHYSFTHKDFQRSPLASPSLQSHRKTLATSSATIHNTNSSPFTFFSSSESDPMLYGYRGQVVEFCFIRSTFKIACADDSRYTEELPWRYDDVHRLYSPYFRLLTDVSILEYVDWLETSEAANCDRLSLKSNFEDFEEDDDKVSVVTTATLSGLESWLKKVRCGIHVRQSISMLYKPFRDTVEVGGERWKNVQRLLRQLQQQKQDRFSSSSDHQMLSEVCPPHPTLLPKPQKPLSINTSVPSKSQQLQQQQQNINGCQGEEMLRQELAQVSLQCDQLCFNLMDIG